MFFMIDDIDDRIITSLSNGKSMDETRDVIWDDIIIDFLLHRNGKKRMSEAVKLGKKMKCCKHGVRLNAFYEALNELKEAINKIQSTFTRLND